MDYAINALLLFPSSEIVVEAAVGLLGNMCSKSDRNRTKAGKEPPAPYYYCYYILLLLYYYYPPHSPQNGSIKLVIEAIQDNTEHEEILAKGLIAITNFAFNNNLNRIICKKLGAISAIVTAMKSHPESGKVQKQACRAVSNIAVNNVDLKSEVHIEQFYFIF
eukprot:sb/3472707/